MNRKLRKLIRDPKQFFLDAKPVKFFKRAIGETPANDENSLDDSAVHQHLKSEMPGLGPFDLLGRNWEGCPEKPIAILWGFAPWKREFISSFLGDYRTAYVRGRTPWLVVKQSLDKQLQEMVFVFWGRSEDERARQYAQERSVRILRMEDGFLRSAGLGARHVRPLSLVLDQAGIYFDPSTPSDLELLLATYDFSADTDLMRRAEAGIAAVKQFRLSKYNLPTDTAMESTSEDSAREKILVIGQVDDDASIRYGCEKGLTSNELVKIAREENPHAEILYKPHPEVIAGLKEQDGYAKVAEICTVVEKNVALADVLAGVSRVYTITSLAGFEALLRGVPVVTFGAPFYSGWGLTEDRQQTPRRSRSLTLAEIFAAAYILYPRYVCPVTDLPMTFEQALVTLQLAQHPFFRPFFTNEKIKEINDEEVDDVDIFVEVPAPGQLPEVLATYAAQLEQHPFGSLLISAIRGTLDVLQLDGLTQILGADRCASFLAPLVHLLQKCVKYNELKVAVDAYVNWYARVGVKLNAKSTNLFFYEINFALRRLNGRVIEAIPQPPLPKGKLERESLELLYLFVRALSMNCEYQRLSDVLDSVEIASAPVWFKLAGILGEKPARSERDGFKRYAIRRLCALRGFEILEAKQSRHLDSKINHLLFSAALGDVAEVDRSIVELLKEFADKKIGPALFSIRLPNGKKGRPARLRELAPVVQLLIKEKRYGLSQKLLDLLAPALTPEVKAELQAKLLVASSGADGLIKHLILNPKLLDNLKLRQAYSRALREKGNFRAAQQALLASRSSKDTKARATSLGEEIEKLEFLHQASEIINSAPQPTIPKGIIALCSLNCLNTLAMVAPMMTELKRLGYAVIHLSAGMLDNQLTRFKAVNGLAGSIRADYVDGPPKLEWYIDWAQGIVESHGVNFYQGIYERLSTYFRRFHIDLADPEVGKLFNSYLASSDYMLRVCLRIQREICSQGIPVVLVSGNSHVAPYSIFRDFALAGKSKNIHFAAVNVAYENYYSNLGGKVSGSMAVVDMTFHRTCRAPFLAIPERFERWYEVNKDSEEVATKVQALIGANRVAREGQQSSSILTVILEAKEAGRKVVCCFGKILCDLAVPYDGGPAHRDIVDWLNHTIDVAQRNPNILLLIKPHPHEQRPEIALDLVEFLRDVVPQKLPENVLFLGHREFNVSELAGLLDLAILWNGTSSLELATLGVPVLMCSHFGRHDYPVELHYPESRDQYEQFIRGGNYECPPPEVRKKAAALLHYMGTDDVALPNRYSRRPITNDKIGVPSWDRDAVRNYLMNGDPYITVAARRVVEGLEAKH